MKKIILLILISMCSCSSRSQGNLTEADLLEYTTYFNLSNTHSIDQKGQSILNQIIGNAQFVGLAEVHQSQQLSFFTAGLLELLKTKGFNNLALEIGPNSARVIEELSKNHKDTEANIKKLNQKYGRNNTYEKPIFFTDKKEDALFVARASELNYNLWGLDQEYDYSVLMNFDDIYKRLKDKSNVNKELFKQSRELVEKYLFKNKIQGLTRNCWFKSNKSINSFLDATNKQEDLQSLINIIRLSWDIYCKEETGNAGQYRANFMKAVFDSKYKEAIKTSNNPKVFLKMGGIHLTHGKSTFGINDIGLHINEKAIENNSNFIVIRHFTRYKNNTDLTGKKGWSTPAFQAMGKKDQWTIIDLKPLKEKLTKGLIKPNEDETWEINNYDAIIIPPNDTKSKSNY